MTQYMSQRHSTRAVASSIRRRRSSASMASIITAAWRFPRIVTWKIPSGGEERGFRGTPRTLDLDASDYEGTAATGALLVQFRYASFRASCVAWCRRTAHEDAPRPLRG